MAEPVPQRPAKSKGHPTAGRSDVESDLAQLHTESQARTDELRAIAAALPAVVGRRAMIRSLVGDTLANPNKGELVRRGFAKAARVPGQVRIAAAHRLGRTPDA